MKRIVLEFRKAKETKGTFRYEEVEPASGEVAVGSLYGEEGHPRASSRRSAFG